MSKEPAIEVGVIHADQVYTPYLNVAVIDGPALSGIFPNLIPQPPGVGLTQGGVTQMGANQRLRGLVTTELTIVAALDTITLGLPNVGPGAGMTLFPSSITLDAKGRTTAIVAGTQPVTTTSNDGNVVGVIAAGNIALSLANAGAGAATYAYPASVTIDAKGRTTAVTAGTQPVTTQSNDGNVVAVIAAGNIALSLANAGAGAATYAYPASVTIDIKGRTTAVTAGPQPVTTQSNDGNVLATILAGNIALSLTNFGAGLATGAYSVNISIDSKGRTSSVTAGTQPVTTQSNDGNVVGIIAAGNIALSLANAGAGAATYAYPTSVTVDIKGRTTAVVAGVQPVTTQTNDGNVLAGIAAGNIALSLANAGAGAATYAYPTSVTIDAKGRTTAAVAGSQPVTTQSNDGNVTGVIAAGNIALALANAGAGAATYAYPTSVTIDAKGRTTAVTAGTAPTSIFFAWSSGATVTAGTRYLVGWTDVGTEINARLTVPANGTLKTLSVKIDAATGVGTSRDFTVLLGGVATALTVTITGSTATTATISTDVAVSQFDRISMQTVSVGGPAAARVYCTLIWQIT